VITYNFPIIFKIPSEDGTINMEISPKTVATAIARSNYGSKSVLEALIEERIKK